MDEHGRRRRELLLAGAAAGVVTACAVPSVRERSPQRQAKQFHNQPAQSHQQQFLADLWEQVGKETDGRLAVTVYPQNNNIPGSDPAALEMLQSGELQFFTLMGGILGRKVPVAEIQGLPFAFTSHAQVHRANDGALGEYLGRAATRRCTAQTTARSASISGASARRKASTASSTGCSRTAFGISRWWTARSARPMTCAG